MRSSTLLTVTLSLMFFAVGYDAMAQKHQHQGGMGQGMQMMQSSCPMHGMQMRKQHTESYSEGRIAFLKAELEITESQEPLFEAYAESVADNLTHMQSMRANMQTMMQAESAVERLSIHIGMMEGRLESLKAMQEPMQALFDVLSDEQKEKASQLMPGMACMQ